MGWPDVENTAIRVVQGKTGAKLWIPLHPELSRVLEAWKKTNLVIVATSFGQRFSSKGLSNYVADKIELAGLPERCVTHGIRKAAARLLAEAGCSANEIAAITGHESLEEVARYTKAAEQKRLAQSAIGRLKKQAANENSQPGAEGWENAENSR
jgi:integrase